MEMTAKSVEGGQVVDKSMPSGADFSTSEWILMDVTAKSVESGQVVDKSVPSGVDLSTSE